MRIFTPMKDVGRSALTSCFILAVLAVPTCAAQERAERPLATWDPSRAEAINDATVGEGALRLDEGCSYLVLETKTVLLVWPEPTSWNADAEAISFVDVFGETLELRAGDQLSPGGAAATATTPFTQAPDPSCEADETFVVATLRQLE